MAAILQVTDVVDIAAMQAIGGGLARFNAEAAGYDDQRGLAVVVIDPAARRPVGGAAGRSSLGLLFLDLFFLPPSLRGQGLGSEVLRRFEAEGRRRGCRAAVLYTISFQAPRFYERHGWRRFGEIPCDPPGTSRIFMTKTLRVD
ncbi:MAG: GNAT family N-acetyltransferase [Pseudomonadota bacterium]